MTAFQKAVRALALALAIFLIVLIFASILSIAGIFVGFSSEDIVDEEMKSYSVDEGILKLDIEIKTADVYIKEGDTFSVESNIRSIDVYSKNGRLTISEPTVIGHFRVNERAVLTIYVPKGTEFESVELSTGAGRLTVGELCAKRVNFEFGTGEVLIDRLIVSGSADINGGAGRIIVSGGEIKDLDMDMGVGELSFTSALRGDCDLDMGIGKANIVLIGNKDDYRLDVDKGIGSVSVDGREVFDLDGGNGTDKVDISGGIGALSISFEEAGIE